MHQYIIYLLYSVKSNWNFEHLLYQIKGKHLLGLIFKIQHYKGRHDNARILISTLNLLTLHSHRCYNDLIIPLKCNFQKQHTTLRLHSWFNWQMQLRVSMFKSVRDVPNRMDCSREWFSIFVTFGMYTSYTITWTGSIWNCFLPRDWFYRGMDM